MNDPRRGLLRLLASLPMLAGLLGQAPASPAVAPKPQAIATDPLPSWNDGPVKRSLLGFVKDVTDPSGPRFVPASERVACFDNDGTLCAERPAYFPVLFLAWRVQQLADRHPEWKANPTLKAVIDGDPEAIARLHTWDLMTLAYPAHTGMTEAEFEAIVAEYLASTRHPRFGAKLTELVYPPMLELLDLLRANGFKVTIVSGGGDAFVRAFSEPVYKVPKELVIGTSVQTEFQLRPDGPALLRLPALVDPICEKAGKPVNILRHVGRRPILAFGNSDGDVPMLQLAEDPRRPFLSLLLRHDDPDREYAYDARSESALAQAKSRGWSVVSMKDDFKVMFPARKP